MKKKINCRMILIAVVAILSTLLMVTLVYYELFRTQVIEDLRIYTQLIRQYDNSEELANAGNQVAEEHMRVTLIGADGLVEYDNEADLSAMENHGERPEILLAKEYGEGQAVRRSETLERNTFYYAVLLQDGSVLRVSKEAGSLYSIFASAFPSILVVVAILIVLCMVMAKILTGKLIEPIEQLAEDLESHQDLTEYKELEPFVDMIKTQHENIIKNARMRQEFTANVSHELKTPLTSISGYAELIETGMASEEDMVRFARGIHNSSNRLLTLINDIIRLSELDGTESEVTFERLNLYELAATCVEMLQMNAEKHKVCIMLQGTECHITGNKQMMEELLYNLCDNAIRYNNENGKVLVEVYPKAHNTVLRVKDTGIGIPKEHQERIFERFYRVDKSRSKSTGGTGLGLAIVKHIIAKHNAQITLESEAGKGTTITIIFSN